MRLTPSTHAFFLSPNHRQAFLICVSEVHLDEIQEILSRLSDVGFGGGLSPWCITKVLLIEKTTVKRLGTFYRAVRSSLHRVLLAGKCRRRVVHTSLIKCIFPLQLPAKSALLTISRQS